MLPVGYSGLTKPAQLTAHEVSTKSFSAVIQLLVVTPTSHVTSLPEVPIALSFSATLAVYTTHFIQCASATFASDSWP